MSIGTGAAIALGVTGAAGGIGSALIGSSAAKSAAKTEQAGAQAGIDETKRQFDVTQGNLAPWLQAGTGALSQLTQGTQPGGSLMTPYGETFTQPAPFSYGAFDPGAKFAAPTGVDESNDPGYAFRLQQGNQAMQRAAAAGGGAFSGGTLKALTRYGQDYASNEYSNVYNRALQGYNTNFTNSLNAYNTNLTGALNQYGTNFSTGLQGYDTRFNAYNTGQTNQYNRLAALSGLGQTTATQLGNLGGANSAAIANLITGSANAGAAGTLGSAAAWNSGLNSLTSGLTGAIGLNALTKGSYANTLAANTPIGGNVPLSVAAGVPTNLWD